MKFSEYLRDRFSRGGQSRKSVFTEQAQQQRAVTLEHQGGQYRVFHLVTGKLVHSHVVKTEAVRRALKDGYLFGVLNNQ